MRGLRLGSQSSDKVSMKYICRDWISKHHTCFSWKEETVAVA